MNERLKSANQVANYLFCYNIHDFLLPAKQVRTDTHQFCLILVLVIPNFVFFFNLRLHIVLEMLLGLIETEETAHDTSYMPPTLKTPYHKWEGSLFIFVRKDACLT